MATGAKKGRPKKPTNLKVLHGDRKDRINTREPVPSTVEVKPPYRLSEDVKKVWDRLAPDRIKKGVLTHWDVDAFAQMCELIVQFNKAMRDIRTRGQLVKGYRGPKVRNPSFQVMRDITAMLYPIASRFGWTPSDRANLMMEEENDADQAAQRLLS